MAGTKKTPTLKRPRKTSLDVLRPFKVAVPNRVEVKRYLSQHPQLAAPLVKICDATRGEFGPDAELSLEVYKDPEMPDQYLTLYVRQDGYTADIMDRIESVVSEFLPQLDRASGHLLVTSDFRLPRG